MRRTLGEAILKILEPVLMKEWPHKLETENQSGLVIVNGGARPSVLAKLEREARIFRVINLEDDAIRRIQDGLEKSIDGCHISTNHKYSLDLNWAPDDVSGTGGIGRMVTFRGSLRPSKQSRIVKFELRADYHLKLAVAQNPDLAERLMSIPEGSATSKRTLSFPTTSSLQPHVSDDNSYGIEESQHSASYVQDLTMTRAGI